MCILKKHQHRIGVRQSLHLRPECFQSLLSALLGPSLRRPFSKAAIQELQDCLSGPKNPIVGSPFVCCESAVSGQRLPPDLAKQLLRAVSSHSPWSKDRATSEPYIAHCNCLAECRAMS